MGVIAGFGKDAAIKKIGELAKFVGLAVYSAESETVGQESTSVIKMPGAHGLSEGSEIIFKSLTGGVGLVLGRTYYVIAEGLTSTNFKIAQKEGGPAEVWTSTLTGGKYVKVTEVTGGTYARVEIGAAWSAPSKGTIEDTTARPINVPASTTIAAIIYEEKTSGTPKIAHSELASAEKLESAGTYTVTNSKLDAEAVA